MDSKTEKKTAKKTTAKAPAVAKSEASAETTPRTRVTKTTRKQSTKDAVAAAPIAAPAPVKPARAAKKNPAKAEKKPAAELKTDPPKGKKPGRKPRADRAAAETKTPKPDKPAKATRKKKADQASRETEVAPKASAPVDTLSPVPAQEQSAPARGEASSPVEEKAGMRTRRESFRPGNDRKNEDAPSGFAAPETVGGNDDPQGGKRKRRRRTKRGERNDNQPQAAAPVSVSIKKLHRRAWQIFLGEVTEEGLALMDDNTARETARRAYRVAEFLLMEAARHDKRAAQSEDAAPELGDAVEE